MGMQKYGFFWFHQKNSVVNLDNLGDVGVKFVNAFNFHIFRLPTYPYCIKKAPFSGAFFYAWGFFYAFTFPLTLAITSSAIPFGVGE